MRFPRFDSVEWSIIALAAFLAFSAAVAVREATAPTFSLRKDAWVCTRYEIEPATTAAVAMDGKTVTLVNTVATSCAQWSARK